VARVEVYDAGGRRLGLGVAAAVSARLCEALERAAWGRDLMDAFMRFAAVYGGAPLRVEGGKLVVEAAGATVAFEEAGGEVLVTVALKVDLGNPEHLADLVARLAGEAERLGRKLETLGEGLRQLEGRLERISGRLERLEWMARLRGEAAAEEEGAE
jgi:hypothetical protein